MRLESIVKAMAIFVVGMLYFDWKWALGSVAFVVALGVLPLIKRYVVSLWRVSPAKKG